MVTLFFICLRLLLIPVLALFLYLSLKTMVVHIIDSNPEFTLTHLMHPYALAFLSGIAGRIFLNFLWKKKGGADPLAFIDTMEHEITHALFGYLTFSPPISLFATLEKGGEVRLRRRNILVVLSPYFFPLWGFCALCVGFLVKDSLQSVWNLFPFFLFGNFIYRLGMEFRWYQQDLKLYGRVFSSVLIFLFLLYSFTAVMHLTHIVNWEWVKGIGPEFLSFLSYLQ
jgi:hypothetical protein